MDNDIYKRQDMLFDRTKIPDVAIIVGCGGVGWWAAMFTAMAGVKNLVLFDHDIITSSNVARLPVKNEHISFPKVDILSSEISLLRPDINITPIQSFADSSMIENTMKILHSKAKKPVLLSAVDKSAVDDELRKFCSEKKIKYVRVGMEGNVITFMTKCGSSVDLDEEDGYIEIPSWVGGAAIAGGIAAYMIVTDVEVGPSMLDFNKILTGKDR